MIDRTVLSDARVAMGLLGLASAGVLAAAFFFQYVLGYQPCVLCLWQRVPFAAVVVFAILALVFARWRGVADGLLISSGLALMANAGIAFYHVGVEQHWWAGTEGCGAPEAALTLEALRAQVMAAPIVRCDQVQWSLFGVSMAGYNIVVSLALAGFALITARIAYRRRSP